MVFDFLKKDKPELEVAASADMDAKASAAGGLTGRHAGLLGAGWRVGWGPRDTVSLTRAGFAANPVGFRSVKMVAEAAAALPLVLRGGAERFEQHPVLQLLSRPNAGQGRSEFLEALYGQILLSGDGYIEAVGPALEGGGVPMELHVLRSDRMSLVPGSDGWPVAYDYAVGGRKHRFDMREATPVCHIRSFHPLDDHYGLSPLQAAARAIDVHNSASHWSKALLDNAARPSGAIVYRGPDGGALTNDQYARLQDELEINHQGARNAGRPMLLEGGLDWKPMGFSPSDMEFQKTKEAAAREIAQALGVPPMLLGIPGDATYANYQEANRAFYRLTVLPLAGKVLGAVSHWLAEMSDEVLDCVPDADQIAALAPEREAHWSRIAAADFLSNAEKRRLLGLPSEEV